MQNLCSKCGRGYGTRHHLSHCRGLSPAQRRARRLGINRRRRGRAGPLRVGLVSGIGLTCLDALPGCGGFNRPGACACPGTCD